jgi:hypothetical protein
MVPEREQDHPRKRLILTNAVSLLSQYPFDYLLNESYSLLARLGQVKPFSMTMPMVKAASVSDKALKEIILLLEKGKKELHDNVRRFIRVVRRAKANHEDVRELQSGFTILKLRFNSILDELDIFAAVLSQRSEYDVGIWTSALDVLAKDGLTAIEGMADLPQLIVYLDRGHGAAIRRARTRLPGGDLNPVGVIQIPRERMIGSGIASSLIHEVGHQAAALLDLVSSLKIRIAEKKNRDPVAWGCFERWISEIIADVWAMGHLGITATLGLMGVVTLPEYFQFRIDLQDPHPAPYIRVMLSCEFGKKLYPHGQWDKLWGLWQSFYPRTGQRREVIRILEAIEREMGAFVDLVVNHNARELKGKRLLDLFPLDERQPERLRRYYSSWRDKRANIFEMPPTLLFAVMGQAKSDLMITAADENIILTKVLRYWAFKRN